MLIIHNSHIKTHIYHDIFFLNRKKFVPEIYFSLSDGTTIQDGDRVLDDDSIITEYTFEPQMYIKILAARYSIEGDFLGISSVLGGGIQLCSDTTTRLNAAYVFGTYYSHSVSDYCSSCTKTV